MVVMPISPTNYLYITLEPLICRITESLPFSLGSFSRYARRGWHFIEKADSHIEMGDTWAMVTPKEIFLHICDPEAINDVFSRREDFHRAIFLYSMLPPALEVEMS